MEEREQSGGALDNVGVSVKRRNESDCGDGLTFAESPAYYNNRQKVLFDILIRREDA
jgi:hypothetical protein